MLKKCPHTIRNTINLVLTQREQFKPLWMELVSTYRVPFKLLVKFSSKCRFNSFFFYFSILFHKILVHIVQDMLNLQKLQNLVSIQHSPLPSLASLQGLSGLSSTAGLNSPLNLSVGSASNLNTSQHSTGGALGGSSQLPQLILASGQLIQGVQGAQLLIPTSQGK